MVRPCLRGRAQYLPKAKTVCGGRFFFGAHFSLGGKKAVSIKFSLFRRSGFHIRPSSNFDLSVCYERGTRFTIIGRRLYLRLPLLRGGSRVAGGEDEKTNDQIS